MRTVRVRFAVYTLRLLRDRLWPNYMYLTHEICHLFRVMCQLYHVLITCYPRKHGRRSRVRRSENCWCHSFYFLYISHLWYATESCRVHKHRYEASGIDTSSNSGARGWTSFKRNILYAIRSLTINGVEINRSVCIHAQTASRCRTRRVHSSIHTAAPTRRVSFASTENTSRCGLSVPDEPDAVVAVCTRATRRVPFANGTRVG